MDNLRDLRRDRPFYFSISTSLMSPHLAPSHFPRMALLTVMVLPPEVLTTCTVPVSCSEPVSCKCSLMTVLPFSPLQSSLNSISLAELESNLFWHDALLCCSMSKPRAIFSGVTQFLESRGLPAFAMLACVAASNLARCSGVRRESMSSEIGGAPSIFPSLAISHKPGLTFSLMGSAASASSIIASAATAVPAIFQCVGCIQGLGGCARCSHLKTPLSAQQLQG